MRAVNVLELVADAVASRWPFGCASSPIPPHYRKSRMCLLPDLHRKARKLGKYGHRAILGRSQNARPIAHEVTALFEKIAAAIGGFDGIADGVGEGLLYDVVRVGGRFGGPISKRAAKAMDRHIASRHLLQHIRHSHVAEAGSGSFPNEQM